MWPWDAHLNHRMRFTLRATTVEGILVNYAMRYSGETAEVVVNVEGNDVHVPGYAIEYWEDLDTGTTNPADITG